MLKIFDTVIKTYLEEGNFDPKQIVLLLIIAMICGLIVSYTYMKTHPIEFPQKSFAVSLVVLPAIMALIIMMIGTNVARAFSLAGVFQVIRYRSQGDAKDMMFILFSMATGLTCAMGFVTYALLITILFCGVIILFDVFHYGDKRSQKQIVKITVPESLNYSHAFDEVFDQYTSYNRRHCVKTVELGSLFEIHYILKLKNDIDEKAFLDAIRVRNGNLNVVLLLDPPDIEFIS